MHAPAPSLFDQSALIDRAERLVKAARAAGADAADAVAVRSLSLAIEVRDGAVEESERAEGDDLGLRVLVGQRQAVVSTNDIAGDLRRARRARGGHGARRARGQIRRSRRRALLAHDFPDLDLIDPELPTVAALEARRARPKRPRSPSKASPSRAAPRRRRHRRHGAGDQPRLPRRLSRLQPRLSMTAIAGEGTGMERDYDYSSVRHAADLDSADKIGRSAGERAVARLNPRKVATRKVPVVFDRRVAGSLVSHLASATNGASVARKTSFLRDKMGAEAVRRRHPHRRRSACASAACARTRSTARASRARNWR